MKAHYTLVAFHLMDHTDRFNISYSRQIGAICRIVDETNTNVQWQRATDTQWNQQQRKKHQDR